MLLHRFAVVSGRLHADYQDEDRKQFNGGDPKSISASEFPRHDEARKRVDLTERLHHLTADRGRNLVMLELPVTVRVSLQFF